MKARKAYILRTDHPRSLEYAKDVADSCDAVQLEWQYVDWYQGQSEEAWKNTGVDRPSKVSGSPAAQCCFSGHIRMWKMILDSKEPGIILEHDGMMLHKPNLDIPDNMMVMMGYKLTNPKVYDWKRAGPPGEILNTIGGGHEGSHAYAITPVTAERLITEVVRDGAVGAIDNRYFLKSRKTTIPMMIMSPVAAVGWPRESTIQSRGRSACRNYDFIDSFKKYYDEAAAGPIEEFMGDILGKATFQASDSSVS